MLSKFALGILWTALAAASLSEHKPQNDGLPLVHADWCVMVKAPPLLRAPENAHDFRLGVPFNDKGIA